MADFCDDLEPGDAVPTSQIISGLSNADASILQQESLSSFWTGNVLKNSHRPCLPEDLHLFFIFNKE